jgi:hypothetical protein
VFLGYWAVATLTTALLLTGADALLLERSRGYFTGGFLSVDYLTGPGDAAAFLGLSLLTDAAIAGVLAGLAMWMLARASARADACGLGGLLAALVPLTIADIVSYELVRYLGDAVDLSLMFDLTGGNVSEILVVASSHLVEPAGMVLAAVAASGGLVWLAHRFGRPRSLEAPAWRLAWLPAGLLVLGLAGSTAASTMSDVLENGLRRKPTGRVIAAVVDAVTDFDRDGYGIAGRTPDPSPFNARIFPYALDVPGNGIDENGVAGDLPAGLPPYGDAGVGAEPWARQPDVVFVVLETFRADLVGADLHGQPVTPVLNRLAAEGVSFDAYSHNGYTAQSRFHLFTGGLSGTGGDPSLVDDFTRQGYRVGYFSGQDESFGGPAFAVGFDRAEVAYDARATPDLRYSTFSTAGSLAVPFTVVQAQVDRFLDETASAPDPLFLYVNFHDTHFPYWYEGVESLVSDERLPRGDIAPDRRDALWNTYANTAANVDRAVGEVIAAVERARGAAPGVIVTADHGESLFDEGFLGHGYALNDVQTRIPLIVAGLPIALAEPVGQADLRPALDAALRTPLAGPADPTRAPAANREVFQYLGTLDRPRQIAFLRATGRTTYDFRNNRLQVGDGPWQDPGAASGAVRDEFQRLVHEWERIALARSGA